jgi:hypothetical protein
MHYYLIEYRNLRQKIQKKINDRFDKMENRLNDQISFKKISDFIRSILPEKHSSPFVRFPDEITFSRAFIYSLVCGENSQRITKVQFLAACNRFGIDNPCPIITKRLSYFGVSEELKKEF